MAVNDTHKTRLLTAYVVLANVVGNLMLGHGMRTAGLRGFAISSYLHAFANVFVIAGVCVLTSWMIANLALLSRADLSYVLPVTSSAYVVVALLGHFVLGEHISPGRWAGILVITVGVTVVGGTAPRTTPEPPPQFHHGARR